MPFINYKLEEESKQMNIVFSCFVKTFLILGG